MPEIARRGLLIGAGIAGGAGLARAAAPPDTPRPLWTAEYWARKGEVSLYLYRKRLAAPAPGEANPPVLFLVHGSSISARPSFDLMVPGAGEYSLMDVFARDGFDVWTMDFEGYGRSSVTEGNSDIASGVADLRAGTDVVARETGLRKAHFMGESSGAIRAAAFAMAEPERVDRLVLEAFTYTGKGSPTLGKRAEQIDYYRTHNRRPRGIDMIRSIFTRDRPGTSDPRVADALAAAELPFGDTVPTGTYLDMTAHLPLVDPKRVCAPVLIVRGQYDGIATDADLLDFFAQLPNPDRQYAIIAG
ncbi:MAG: alpha/beta hydrolase, partial [Acetobacteraceae bacterium]|nr:alpha/beta hydrolase [Acetobacteraceae bacterium]